MLFGGRKGAFLRTKFLGPDICHRRGFAEDEEFYEEGDEDHDRGLAEEKALGEGERGHL